MDATPVAAVFTAIFSGGLFLALISNRYDLRKYHQQLEAEKRDNDTLDRR